MIQRCFWKVAIFLQLLAKKTKLTYNEVNVIVYYFIIPLTWCIMLDCIIHTPVFSFIWITLTISIWLCIDNFSDWCDKLFKLSQQFICFFGEYIKYSVIICVIIPVIIYGILIFLMLKYY